MFDIDGNGRQDVLVSHNSRWSSSIFYGGPSGVGTAVEGNSSGPATVPLMLDLDGDGLIDLAALVLRDDETRLVLLPGRTGGTFGPPIVQPLVSTFDSVFEAGDFDGDGRQDLLITDADGAWGVRVWRNAVAAVTLTAPATTKERQIDLDWTTGAVARLQIRIDGPGGRSEVLQPAPHSGTTRFTAWGDGEYRFRATAYAADGSVLGTSESATVFDTASTIELDVAPFGVQTVGTASAPIPVLVRNQGVRATTVTALALGENPDFRILEDGCSDAVVGVWDTCTVLVRFTPGAGGPRTTTLTVATEAAFAPRTFALSGVGFEPAGSAPRPSLPAPHVRAPAPAPAQLVSAQRAGRTTTRFRTLRLERIGTGSTVTVSCPKGCSRTAMTRRNVSGVLSLTSFAKRPLRVGTRITVTIATPGRAAQTLTLTVRASKAPRLQSR
jgi:hypothetical protein